MEVGGALILMRSLDLITGSCIRLDKLFLKCLYSELALSQPVCALGALAGLLINLKTGS